jgi:DNA repair protein RadD
MSLPRTADLVGRLSADGIRAVMRLESSGPLGLAEEDARNAIREAYSAQELWADDQARAELWRCLTAAEIVTLNRSCPAAQAALDSDTPPTGPALREVLDALGLAIPRRREAANEVVPQRPLFAHQRDVVNRAQAALERGVPRRAVLHMPTGSGKTRVALQLVCARLVASEPSVVLWFAQTRELLDQAADEFERAWSLLGNRPLEVVRFWGSEAPSALEIDDGVVVIGLAKAVSLNRTDPPRLRRLAEKASLVVIDEAHQAIAPTYAAVLEKVSCMNPGCMLLGLTATPGRTWSDIEADQALADFWNRNIVTLEAPTGYQDVVEYLTAEGFLAAPTFRCLRVDDPSIVAVDSGEDLDYPDDSLAQAAFETAFNAALVAEIAALLGTGGHQRVLVFAASVEHAHLLTVRLVAEDLDASCVTGETPSDQRERIVSRFSSNAPRPMCVVNFGVLTTGVDVPQISAVVIARPTRSLVLYSQMVGRGLRGPRAGGTETCEIVTVVPPSLPGFGDVAEAFLNWTDVYESGDH